MTSPWFMSKRGASKQGTQTQTSQFGSQASQFGSQASQFGSQASHFGSKRWIVQLLPIAVSIFLVAALLTYHLRLHENAGPDASGWVQGLVVVIYDFFGFAPAMVLALLGMAWSSISFFAGKLDRPGVITARVLTFVVCLAILGNLGGEGRGALGAYLAEPLRSVYWLSMIVITGATLVSAFLATDFFFYRYFEGGGFEVAGTSGSTAAPRVISAASRYSGASLQASAQGDTAFEASGSLGSDPSVSVEDRLSAAGDLSAEDQLDAEITRLASLASDAMSAEAEAETRDSETSDSRFDLDGGEGVGNQELDQLKSLDLSADALPRPAEDLGDRDDSDEIPVGRAARRRLRLREYSQQEVEPDALDLNLTESAPAPIDALADDRDGFEPFDGEGSRVDADVTEDTAAEETGTEETGTEETGTEETGTEEAGTEEAGTEETVAGEALVEISRAAEVEAKFGIDEDHIASAVDEVVRDLHRAVEEGSSTSGLVGEEAEIAREAKVSEVQFPRYDSYTSALDATSSVTPPRTSDGDTPADIDSHEDAFEHAAPEEHASIGFDPDATEPVDAYDAHAEAGPEGEEPLPDADDAESIAALGLGDDDADQDIDLVGFEQTDLVAATAAQRFDDGDDANDSELGDEAQAARDLSDELTESSVEVSQEEQSETLASDAEAGPQEVQVSGDEEVFEFEYEDEEEAEQSDQAFGTAEAEGCTDPVTDEVATAETPVAEDYVLPRPDPEFVAARQGQLFGSAEEDADLVEEAASLVRETGRANANFFRRRLRISTDEAKAVLAQLAERGLIEYEPGAVQGRVIADEAR